ncbi:DUF2017 domain-containing protein [Streptomyces sp. NBC_00237]|uniref:DUF2017 domain-containing protein n=1 Tax=Streptomyces sp. NBC_00237 TaxID=2975687 RepID=UPI00225A6702|nr:DUF2017 domain-containing protein [Streptomyces sp. NBC_00237]MCX5200925.1 DUF2017 domain-containing protein [Streptomyces sp. NBC_00237]
MAGYFEAVPDGGAAIALDTVETSILRSLAVQLLELIGPGDEPVEGADPLAALFAEGPSEAPADPALARLFPEAYVDPRAEPDARQRESSAEFRRFTENDLRTRKREDALSVVRNLDALASAADEGEPGLVLKLTPEESRRWLGTLNDLRLTIASRLDITEEDESEDLYRLPDEDPRKPMVMAYLWLGGMQETLVETLMP